MTPSAKSPRPPLPSPALSSGSLQGMEKVIPPRSRSSQTSSYLHAPDGMPSPTPQTRTSSRSRFSPTLSDKPLPKLPCRSSSVYSDEENEYTHLVESYSDSERRHDSLISEVIQPIAYRQTVAPILHSRLEEPPSPKSVTPAMSEVTLGSDTSQNLRKTYAYRPAALAQSSGYGSETLAPKFKEFSSRLRTSRKNTPKSIPSPSPSPRKSPATPLFRAVSYESTKGKDGPAPQTWGALAEQNLVPAPLSVYKDRGSNLNSTPDAQNPYLQEEAIASLSRFSDSSDDKKRKSKRGSALAYVRQKIQDSRDPVKKERRRVMSVASAKYPGMLTADEYDRRQSLSHSKSVSRSGSNSNSGLTRGQSISKRISDVYGKIQRLSLSASSSSDKEPKAPSPRRGRRKQLAIPASPYQMYGPSAWEAEDEAEMRSRKQQGKKARLRARKTVPARGLGRKRTIPESSGSEERPASSGGVGGALRSGRSQIIHALGGGMRGNAREEEKRRVALKQSIKLVGPTHVVSDGSTTYRV